MKEITLKEIKEIKKELKEVVTKLLMDFNFRTGTTINNISISYNDYETDSGYLFSQVKEIDISVDYEKEIK